MKQDRIVDSKAFAFAVRIVSAFKHLVRIKREFVLSKQLLRSGTSIGANIAEARGAVSRRDFSNKMAIAYKECLETKYWLDLLHTTGYLKEKAYKSIFSDADELGRILYSIVKKTRPDRKD
ncbi:MAG: four helix bundle protein [Acidobacteria bacterium]|nr:MAG: four helix bundle protein [Acidobacteriota bacterium]REK02686.1 MAG: four helix bundle protein [Acidobacteriota bacterium]REK13509.1 MAG: four helix bundle protein [Acidobacteriota bacterium]REK41503.1 MAG: four helix bundle protein [Acidobacteriota bacterium]